MNSNPDLFSIAIPCATFVFGIASYNMIQRIRMRTFDVIAQQTLDQAEKDATAIKQKAEMERREKELIFSKEQEQIWQTEKRKLLKEDERLKQREDKIEMRLSQVEKKLVELEKREQELTKQKITLEQHISKNKIISLQLQENIEKASNMSSEQAKDFLLDTLKAELSSESNQIIKKIRDETELKADQETARILSIVINRMASSITSEATSCTVPLLNDEMKGRIIGREGRNIRTFEKLCGVSLIMDDTPQTVVISCFDPIRRQIAKQALTDLVADGRIHPTRIEESVLKAADLIQKQIRHFGEEAAYKAGALNLHPELTQLLGRLKFRFSLGQNVLDHSIEVSYLLGLMAAELGLNIALAKRIGLLHDIGKAVSHEISGSHALVGRDLALKYGETKWVANGIGCHHYEIEAETIEASLCSAADTISASRPGARIEAVEEYIQRLQKLEEMAITFPGVEKAYALQAGREVRVFALPDVLSDEGIYQLAKNLTKKIETELDYPGKIKVSVFREKRVIDYAM